MTQGGTAHASLKGWSLIMQLRYNIGAAQTQFQSCYMPSSMQLTRTNLHLPLKNIEGWSTSHHSHFCFCGGHQSKSEHFREKKNFLYLPKTEPQNGPNYSLYWPHYTSSHAITSTSQSTIKSKLNASTCHFPSNYQKSLLDLDKLGEWTWYNDQATS